MSAGTIIRRLRGEKSLAAMAKDIGITKSSLAMYERDERTPRDETKVQIANYCGIPVQAIFFNNGEHE